MTDKKDTPTNPAENPTTKKGFGNLTAGIIFDSQEDLENFRREQGQESSHIDSPIIQQKSPTDKATSKKYSPIKKAKTPTEKKPVQHNKIRQDELVKWTVFVQQETKTAVALAVEKAGVTVTDWIDSRLRQAANDELTKKAQPPIKTEDLVADIVQQFADRMKADQAATAKAQNDLIEQQGAQIAQLAQTIEQQPRSFKEMLFGKPKPSAAE